MAPVGHFTDKSSLRPFIKSFWYFNSNLLTIFIYSFKDSSKSGLYTHHFRCIYFIILFSDIIQYRSTTDPINKVFLLQCGFTPSFCWNNHIIRGYIQFSIHANFHSRKSDPLNTIHIKYMVPWNSWTVPYN